jgi:hypothetical protein
MPLPLRVKNDLKGPGALYYHVLYHTQVCSSMSITIQPLVKKKLIKLFRDMYN